MSDDDLHTYLHHIAHVDLPLEAKIELLRALRTLMQSFVDRAFGEDAVQLARKDGDEFQIACAADSAAVVSSNDHTNTGDKALSGAFAKRAGRAKRKDIASP
ncbi:MAG: hypothetical protein DI527_20875 [Chelatococcus sp.]|nr:MAG: hypothetical protein DI527_20875 [Chelatococcus sp.]